MDNFPLDVHSQILSFQDKDSQKMYVVANPLLLSIYHNRILDADFWLNRIKQEFSSIEIPNKYCDNARLLENFHTLLINAFCSRNKSLTFEFMHYEILLLLDILMDYLKLDIGEISTIFEGLIRLYISDVTRTDIKLLDGLIYFFKDRSNDDKNFGYMFCNILICGIRCYYEKNEIDKIPPFIEKINERISKTDIAKYLSYLGSSLKYDSYEKGLLLQKTIHDMGYKNIPFPIVNISFTKIVFEYRAKTFDTKKIDLSLFECIFFQSVSLLDLSYLKEFHRVEKCEITPIRFVVLLSIFHNLEDLDIKISDLIPIKGLDFRDAINGLRNTENLDGEIVDAMNSFEDYLSTLDS